MSTPQYLEFILTQKFDRMTRDWMDDTTLQILQTALIEQPDAGAVVAGTGGVRKVRVALPGRGKSGSGGKTGTQALGASLRGGSMTTKQTRKRSTRKQAPTSFGQDLIEAMQEVVAIEATGRNRRG